MFRFDFTRRFLKLFAIIDNFKGHAYSTVNIGRLVAFQLSGTSNSVLSNFSSRKWQVRYIIRYFSSFEDFTEEAYKATDRRDLLLAINEFLDYSIVLPPDNWERHALLSLRELRAKNAVIRKRRNRLREEVAATKGTPRAGPNKSGT